MAYRFLKRESLGNGVRRIACEQIEEVLKAIDSSASPAACLNAEAVHSARKALKKLRALLRLVRKQIGEEVFLRESACCRDAGRLLSLVRDADVRLATFDSLAGDFGDQSREGINLIRKAFLNDVRKARRGGLSAKKLRTVSRTLELARVRMRLLTIGEGWKVLRSGLRRSFRRACKSFDATFESEPNVELLHACRKRFKDLHYQLGLLRPAFGPDLKKIEDEIKKMGELLGEDRDLGLLCENLRSRTSGLVEGVPPEAAGSACETITRRQDEIQQKAAKLGRKVIGLMEDAFPKTLGKCWKKWRAKAVSAPSPVVE